MLKQLKQFFPIAEKVIDRKSTITILKHLCVDKGMMRVTDLEHSVSMPVDDERSYTIPMKILKQVLKTKPLSLVVELIDENKVRITFDKKSVVFTNGSPDEFPEDIKEKFEQVGVWTKDVFIRLYNQTVFTSTDELRMALLGIYVEQGKTLSSCATDGHALQKLKNLDPEGNCQLLQDLKVIIPNKPILLVAKHAAGNVKIFLGKDLIRFRMANGIELTSQLIDAKYPDYGSVIPAKQDHALQFKKSDMLTAIKDARPFANPYNYKALFHLNNGSVTVSTENADDESTFTTDITTVNHTGTNITMAFDLDLVDRAVKAIEGEQVLWKYTDENKASTFFETADDQYQKLNLLMPIKIRE